MNKNQVVTLLAAVFFNKQNLSNCPVCGKEKDGKKMVCIECFSEVGDAAVFNRAMADLSATFGHENAVKTGVQRGYLMEGQFFANRKVGKSAKLFTPKEETGIKPYYQFSVPVVGGNLDVNVFGATEEDLGHYIAGVVEVKYRDTKAGQVPYLRIQKVEGVASDVNLVIGKFNETPENHREDLPLLHHKGILNKDQGENERLLMFSIGFADVQPVAKAA